MSSGGARKGRRPRVRDHRSAVTHAESLASGVPVSGVPKTSFHNRWSGDLREDGSRVGSGAFEVAPESSARVSGRGWQEVEIFAWKYGGSGAEHLVVSLHRKVVSFDEVIRTFNVRLRRDGGVPLSIEEVRALRLVACARMRGDEAGVEESGVVDGLLRSGRVPRRLGIVGAAGADVVVYGGRLERWRFCVRRWTWIGRLGRWVSRRQGVQMPLWGMMMLREGLLRAEAYLLDLGVEVSAPRGLVKSELEARGGGYPVRGGSLGLVDDECRFRLCTEWLGRLEKVVGGSTRRGVLGDGEVLPVAEGGLCVGDLPFEEMERLAAERLRGVRPLWGEVSGEPVGLSPAVSGEVRSADARSEGGEVPLFGGGPGAVVEDHFASGSGPADRGP